MVSELNTGHALPHVQRWSPQRSGMELNMHYARNQFDFPTRAVTSQG